MKTTIQKLNSRALERIKRKANMNQIVFTPGFENQLLLFWRHYFRFCNKFLKNENNHSKNEFTGVRANKADSVDEPDGIYTRFRESIIFWRHYFRFCNKFFEKRKQQFKN